MMVNVLLMNALVKAIPDKAALLIVGDVEHGGSHPGVIVPTRGPLAKPGGRPLRGALRHWRSEGRGPWCLTDAEPERRA